MKECQLCKNCFTDDVNTCPNDGMPTFHSISGEPVLEGKYHLECRLGQGGMGVVYKARHSYLKTQLAIKIILPDLVGNDPELVQRFRQEALAAAAIRHQNVVGVSDYGVAQGTMPFLVMEYVEGESLHELLEREKKLAPETALDLMEAIGKGIAVAHKQGIVHRDLKPLNIMIQKDMSSMKEAVKILDFGLAKIKSGELLGSFVQAQTTGLMGSPFYMAPEQWADEEPDARSDIYSLGIMFFQMIAGDVPFKGNSIPAIMKKHISDHPPTFADMGIVVQPQLERAVRHALAKNRNDRTATVELFIEELITAIRTPDSDQEKQKSMLGLSTQAHVSGSSLQILTIPPQSQVFVDNVEIGHSRADGWLLLEGLQSGNHMITVKQAGFLDWEKEFASDGSPIELVAELTQDANATPGLPRGTSADLGGTMQRAPRNLNETRGFQGGGSTTAGQGGQQIAGQETIVSNQRSIFVESQPPKRSFFTPLVIALTGIFGLLVLGMIVVGGAYLAGAFNDAGPTPTPTATVTPSPEEVKHESILIPGGTFTMGNDQGRENEKPEHQVTVESFYMDKTEVTNAEYHKFVTESGYTAPVYFIDGKPLPGTEMNPVYVVSHKDAEAFAQWRSKKDNLEYRLPTEQEWEYASRNGSKNNLYPWGDKYEEGMAVIGRSSGNPQAVGSLKGANQWGVQDLIGNVWEWTATEASLYPGSLGFVKKTADKRFMVRGGFAGSAIEGELAITATFREPISELEANKGIGFRLVRSE